MEPLPDRGRLGSIPLPRLLLELERRRVGGTLVLSHGRVTRRIQLREGAPVHVTSSRASESLAAHLRASGQLDEEQHARVGERTSAGGREEVALLELRLLGPKDLLMALRDHARRLLLDCFDWEEGEFVLEAGKAPASDASLLRLDPTALALDGVASRWGPDRILAGLAPKLMLYPTPLAGEAKRLARLPESSPARRLLAVLDGHRTLDEAIREVGETTALAAAWVLEAAGALAFQSAPSEESAEVEPTTAEAPPEEPELEIVVETRSTPTPAAASANAAARPAEAASRSDDAEALRQEIEDKSARLDELDHYEVLGVPRNAKPTAVKRAYFGAAKRFHPDALSRLGFDELKPRASELFARMAKAYEVLSDFERRREYDETLGGGGDEAEAARLVQAETLFRKGEILLRAGNFAGALEFLGPAVQLWPEEATYQSALGWALYRSGADRAEDALPHLERAVALEPSDATAQQRLGAILRALGRDAAAGKAFARAKELGGKGA